MIAFSFGLEIAVAFVLLITKLHAWMEMQFDKRATQVFDADGTRSEEELKIIHANQMPIRGLLIVCMTLAADMQELWPTVALLGVGITYFWIVFDIFCAVVWLGKPWYYAGDPPPYGINPYMFFIIKGILFAACMFLYFRLSTQHFSQGIV
jgi:hypothetical protein